MRIEDESGSPPDMELATDNQAVDNSEKIGETEDSLLAVIQNVSEQSGKSQEDASESESPPESDSQEAVSEQAESQKEEDYSKLPFGEHPRFKKLVAQKHEFRKMAQSFEADAKQYRDIQTFMNVNDLSPEEVAKALDVLAKAKKGDPAEAYKLMQARMDELALASGQKLPTDLEDRIEQGYIDRETAQELHQHRVKAERQAQIATSQLERRSQQDAQQQTVAMAQAVQTWEQSTKAADPDFELKVELVKDRVRAAIATNGMPKTADEALKLSKEAYESVTQVLRRAQGTRQSMRPAVGGKVNGSAAPEPRNLLDVIRQSAGA